MGTRGNILVHDGDKTRGVVMYRHWDADTVLPEVVKTGLKRGESRWDDFTYLARIIFTDLIRDDLDGITGIGLAASIKDVDGNDLILDVDCRNGVVTYEGDWGDNAGEQLTFEAFAAS